MSTPSSIMEHQRVLRIIFKRVVEVEKVAKELCQPYFRSHVTVPCVSTLRDRELLAVRRYLQNITYCRRQWLLEHFDVKASSVVDNCCDVCNKTATTVTDEEDGSCESEEEF